MQALLHRYETFRRADGHVVKLPMDRGEGQQWNRAPGNLYSSPRQIEFDPARPEPIAITLDRVIPPIPDPPDDKVHQARTDPERAAHEVLGPSHASRGERAGARGLRRPPRRPVPAGDLPRALPVHVRRLPRDAPDPNLPCEPSERFHLDCYNRTEQEQAHEFYKTWTGPDYPRMLIVEIQHANPYYDDSYAVNSANLGPYGDAITYELIPYLEKKYRGIGQPWARFMYGGSTGGWEAIGAQILYPDEYNGCYAACPDPIDFRAYTTVDIYADRNAYYREGPWRRVARPGHRNYLGHVDTTVEDMNRLELVLGTRGRSGGQWDIWQAVFSPVGPGWLPRADLGQAHRRDRPAGGRPLARALRPLAHPAARLEQGPREEARGQAEHLRRRHGQLLPEQRRLPGRGLPAEHEGPLFRRRDRLRRSRGALLERRPHATQRRVAAAYHQFFAPKIVRRILDTAPPGGDVKSWRY